MLYATNWSSGEYSFSENVSSPVALIYIALTIIDHVYDHVFPKSTFFRCLFVTTGIYRPQVVSETRALCIDFSSGSLPLSCLGGVAMAGGCTPARRGYLGHLIN
jgi:hypothetical protein